MVALILIIFFSGTSVCQGLGPFVHVPTTVAAGSPVNGTIDINIYAGDTTYVDHVRIFLIASPNPDINTPEFFHSTCKSLVRLRSPILLIQRRLGYLNTTFSICNPSIIVSNNHITFQNTTFVATVPSNAGPPGLFYALEANIIETDGSEYGGGVASNAFNLTAATGNWSRADLDDLTLITQQGYIPCSSFPCVRACADQFYKSGAITSDGYDRCVGNCPGLSYSSVASSTSSTAPDTSLITFTGTDAYAFPTTSILSPAACVYSSTSTTVASQPIPTLASASPTSTSSSSPSSAAAAGLLLPPSWMITTGFFISGLLSSVDYFI
jgi:hypothetical protein